MIRLLALYLAAYLAILLGMLLLLATGSWANNPLAVDTIAVPLVPALAWFLAEKTKFGTFIIGGFVLVITGVYLSALLARPPIDLGFMIPLFALIYLTFGLTPPIRNAIVKAFPDWFGGEDAQTSATAPAGS